MPIEEVHRAHFIDKFVISATLAVNGNGFNRARSPTAIRPLSIQARIAKVFQRLERWPEVSGAKPLSGALAGRYRIRTGDYRVQFSVRKGIVWIEKVGHRDGFYEG